MRPGTDLVSPGADVLQKSLYHRPVDRALRLGSRSWELGEEGIRCEDGGEEVAFVEVGLVVRADVEDD